MPFSARMVKKFEVGRIFYVIMGELFTGFLALNTACAKALKSGTHRLKDVKRLIGDKAIQGDFDFAQTHPLIRELKVYGDFIHQQQTKNNEPYTQTTSPEYTKLKIIKLGNTDDHSFEIIRFLHFGDGQWFKNSFQRPPACRN